MKLADMIGGLNMTKRNGVSLVNVMVFMLFAAMVTAQVFFFMNSSMESIAEDREILMYRLKLDTLVEEAKKELENPVEKNGHLTGIKHDDNLHLNPETNTLTYKTFFDGAAFNGIDVHTQTKYFDGSKLKWDYWNDKDKSDWKDNETYYAVIYDLDYNFNSSFSRNDYTPNYSGSNMYRKIFAAMPVETEDKNVPLLDPDGNPLLNGDGTPQTTVQAVPVNRYYLIRACAKLPEKFYGRHLMYQVLVRRNKEDDDTAVHELETLSFQEVWF